eukprot:scaffold3136_cov95-Skeletonema_dohrnii-CCMP3373.AAC.2
MRKGEPECEALLGALKRAPSGAKILRRGTENPFDGSIFLMVPHHFQLSTRRRRIQPSAGIDIYILIGRGS